MPIVNAVTATPSAGTYKNPVTVLLVGSAGTAGTLYWTQDGTIPNPALEVGAVGSASIYVNQGLTLNVILVTTSGTSAVQSFPYGIVNAGRNIPAAGPTKRIVDIRSLSFGISGQIQPYPVYQFSGYRTKWERDRHNPFAPGKSPPYE